MAPANSRTPPGCTCAKVQPGRFKRSVSAKSLSFFNWYTKASICVQTRSVYQPISGAGAFTKAL
eukprot:4667984-Pyramimonas_sp.AAC.1